MYAVKGASSSSKVVQELQEVMINPLTNSQSKINYEEMVTVKNSQRSIPIDTEVVREKVVQLKSILGVPDFELDVWFCSEAKIRELNREWRDKSKSTDVLSFPANEFSSPGVFIDDGTLQYAKLLGDLVIAPAYVLRQCQRDQKDYMVSILRIVIFCTCTFWHVDQLARVRFDYNRSMLLLLINYCSSCGTSATTVGCIDVIRPFSVNHNTNIVLN